VADTNENITYVWSFEGGDIAMGATHTISSITTEQAGIYVVTATDNYNCISSSEVQVNVQLCEILIPEVLSPNGDGANDVFFIENILAFPNTSLTIYNRWGANVYDNRNYLNDWDGVSSNKLTIGNERLPEGIYYYVVVLGGDNQLPTFGKIYNGYFYIKYI
jgi:gliding motility-associated-like protein